MHARDRICLGCVALLCIAGCGNGPAAPESTPATRAKMSVAPEVGLTFPAGTTFDGFKAAAADPTAPFHGESVLFRGWQTGGSKEMCDGAHLVYRLRLSFAQAARIQTITIQGAGHKGNKAQIRLLDQKRRVVAQQRTQAFNKLATTVLRVDSRPGTLFYLEEYDYSTHWRYCQSIVVKASAAR